MRMARSTGSFLIAAPALAVLGLVACAPPSTTDEIPITTASDEARQLYVEARDLSEALRTPDARELFRQAIEKDPSFALAHLGLANTAATATDFFESLGRAVELSGDVSDGEQWMILAVDASARGDITAQEDYYRKLTESFPQDERARTLLAGVYYARQDYELAIDQLEKATETAPDYSPPYNTLGYAFRATKEYARAEEAFRRYIELVPDEPNPYDSYAELLMKMGRFEESIENYRAALEKDDGFYASYIGIGNDQILMGDPEAARETFQQLYDRAHDDFERRQAIFWTAASYIHEGDYGKAEEEVRRHYAIAEASDDKANMSADLVFMGDLFVEIGEPDRAEAMYQEAVATMNKADVLEDVKRTTRRNHVYREARVALLRDDLDLAREKAEDYRQQVEAKGIPQELRRSHELAGRIAIAEGDFEAAITALEKADQENPEVLLLRARACRGVGDEAGAREFSESAAAFNGIDINYAYVRGKAEKMLDAS